MASPMKLIDEVAWFLHRSWCRTAAQSCGNFLKQARVAGTCSYFFSALGSSKQGFFKDIASNLCIKPGSSSPAKTRVRLLLWPRRTRPGSLVAIPRPDAGWSGQRSRRIGRNRGSTGAPPVAAQQPQPCLEWCLRQ